MNALHYMRIIARALDYVKDPDPNHWKTINGSHVHLDKNGNYDGGAGSKFNGRHHYGPDWRQKSALMNRLAAALHGGVAKGQAQGNTQGTSQGQNVASQTTNGMAGNGTIRAEEEKKAIENIRNLHDATEQAYNEYKAIERRLIHSNNFDPDLNQKFTDAILKLQRARDAENRARDDATAKGIPFVSTSWSNIEKSVSANQINSVPVNRHSKQPDESEIIKRISGGDRTSGSCASVAFAYIANKCGLDALDFRGGSSMALFSTKDIKKQIMGLPGIEGKEISVKKPAPDGAKVLLGLEKDKEYYLSFERHAAIVKNTDKGVMYLELQDPNPDGNRWHLMGDNPKSIAFALSWRFKAAKTQHRSGGRPYDTPMRLLSVDSFKGSKEFEKITEYFNTNAQDQKKGVQGYVK